MGMLLRIALAIPLLMAPVTLVRAAGTPAKCAASKQKAAGKKAAAELNCYSKAVATAVPVDSTCLAKAATKFMSAFTKAETAGGCAVVGDATFQESAIDAFVAATAAENTTTFCTSPFSACGSTCETNGTCARDCPDLSGVLRCVNNVVLTVSSCLSDFDCQAVLPGSVCVSGDGTTCSTITVCAMPCP
jgi:hypothetical protein